MASSGKAIVVIGGGVAGLSAAFRLAKSGHQVRLLEADDRLGGRVGRRQVRRISFNAGARLVYPFSKPFNAMLDELGLSASLRPIGHLVARCDGPGDEHWQIELMPGLKSLLTPGLSARERLRFLRLGASLLRRRALADPDDAASVGCEDAQTLETHILRVLGPNVLERMIEPVFRGTRSWNSETASPSFFLSTAPYLIGGASPSVFAGGMDALPNALSRHFSHETGMRVLQVETTGPGPCRVTAEKDGTTVSYEADIVVSAIEGDKVKATVPDLPPEDRAFFADVRYNPCAIAHYQIDGELPEDMRFFHRRANAILSTYEQSPADGANNRPAQIYAQLTPEAAMEARQEGLTERLHAITDAAVRQLYPALDRTVADRHSQWIERMLPLFYPGYGLAVRAFRERRAQKRQTIYFCGDYLGQALLTGAATSGLRIADQINRDWA
jgi:oxygen-dependent protoporphyrinogen oxidase